MNKNSSILDFPFGATWERRVLYEAGESRFITIRIAPNDQAPEKQNLESIVSTWKKVHQGYYGIWEKENRGGDYIVVGEQWLMNNLSDEEFASYIVRRLL